MLTIITMMDKPNSLDLRMATRPQHVEYLGKNYDGIRLLMGGPLLNEDGAMIGSHLVVETTSRAILDKFLDNDPYCLAGLFASRNVQIWNKTIDKIHE